MVLATDAERGWFVIELQVEILLHAGPCAMVTLLFS